MATSFFIPREVTHGCSRLVAVAVLALGASGCSLEENKPGQPTQRRTADVPEGTSFADDSERPANSYDQLRRPPRKPTPPSGRCPKTDGVTNRRLGSPLGNRRGIAPGRGPAYPNFFTGAGRYDPSDSGAAGHVQLPRTRPVEGWHDIKVLWGVHPLYRGDVLVRGTRIDGRGLVGFGDTYPPKAELLLPRFGGQRKGSWRSYPTRLKVQSAGCYALQIDTDDATSVIVAEIRE